MELLYLKEAEAAYNLSLSTNIQVDKGNYLDFELIKYWSTWGGIDPALHKTQ